MADKIGLITHEIMAARAAITDLVHGYARGVRQRDISTCAAMFTQDAVFEVRDADLYEPSGYRLRYIFRGPGEIQDYLEKGAMASISVVPVIQNLIISVNGLKATSNCLMLAFVMPDGRQIIGEYEDSFRCDDEWRFSARTYTILGQLNHAKTANPT